MLLEFWEAIAPHPSYFFCCLGGVFLAAELLGTAGYALWAGFAALLVAGIALIIPLSWLWLWFIFAIATLTVAYIWWQWSKLKLTKQKTRLNDLNRNLIGRYCIVSQAIEGGKGRVKVADSTWMALSEIDLPVGEKVVIIHVDGITLHISPINHQ